MKYSSLQEYFYKLQNVLYLLILIPLLVFIFFFTYKAIRLEEVFEENIRLANGVLSVLAAIAWLLSFVFLRKLKTIRKMASLGLRLERYYSATIVRFAFISFADILLIGGFFITGNLIFSVLFGLNQIVFLLIWPRPSKVCLDLKLKGDEREMVYYKKMNLY